VFTAGKGYPGLVASGAWIGYSNEYRPIENAQLLLNICDSGARRVEFV
jgi:hypothetical protein